jgi:hypothetical protein
MLEQRMKSIIFSILLILSVRPSGFAYHPLITDDTGTQGRGGFQYELNLEYGHDSEEGVKTDQWTIGTTLTYGLVDNLDISAGIPYLYLKERDGEVIKEDGIGDLTLDIKYRFYEKDGLRIALKPGLSFPTGEYERGFGSGRISGRIFLIIDKEFEAVTLFLNGGYIRNENKVGERKDLWHMSLAGEYRLMEGLKIVLNTGIEANPEKGSNTHPVFLLGGLVYSVTDSFDLSGGIKTGLNSAETDLSALAGITLRFK